MSQLNRLLAVCLLFAMSWAVAAANDSLNETLMFEVFLDGKKIGYHRFEIDGPRSNAAVRSEASFDVKFLFVTAFSYRHSAQENWAGGCLNEPVSVIWLRSNRCPSRTSASASSRFSGVK